MQTALADVPNTPFRVPRGIKFMKTDLKSGWQLSMLEEGEASGPAINEAYITGGPIYIPGKSSKAVLDALTNLNGEFDLEEAPPTLPWRGTHDKVEETPAMEAPIIFEPSLNVPADDKPLPPIMGGSGLY